LKVVFDTNVILSSFLTEGLSQRVFDRCLNDFEIVISEWILAEVREKLRKKFGVPSSEVKELIDFLRNNLSYIEPKGEMPRVCRDKDDNNILRLASFAKAEVIITGDKDLLILQSYLKTIILTPRQFFEKYLK